MECASHTTVRTDLVYGGSYCKHCRSLHQQCVPLLLRTSLCIWFLFVSSDTAVWPLRRSDYFSSNLAVDNLATCLASGHDPSAYGTLTLWIIRILGLYSPFKAHTNTIIHKLTELFAKAGAMIYYYRYLMSPAYG